MGAGPGQMYVAKYVAALTVVSVLLVAISPNSLRLLFPLLAVVVAYRILIFSEACYISFVLWIYILSPFVRRIVDWKTSYQEHSLILIAPLLVTLIPCKDLYRRFSMVPATVRNAALLVFAGIFFGFGVGMIKHPSASTILAALTWSAPIVLFVFAASIRDRARLIAVLNATLLWGVVVMSLYGIYQFVVAPPWDTYWLRQISADSIAPSFGQPRPMAIRVWSTMNAPGPFAVVLSAALIWLSGVEGSFPIFCSSIGYIALSLTLVRSAWLQTAFALLICFCFSGKRRRMKNTIIPWLIAASVAGLFIGTTESAGFIERLKTFSSLGSDESVNERKEMYVYMLDAISETPSGAGLESVTAVHGFPLDSSLMQIVYMLGWIGALCYLVGFSYLLVQIGCSIRRLSQEQVSAAAITVAGATQLFSGDVVSRQGGVFLWLFAGLWVSLSLRYPSPAVNRVTNVGLETLASRLEHRGV